MPKEHLDLKNELELSSCDIEIQKYHMSTTLSLMMPFILTFASVGIGVSDTALKVFFITLSMVLLFFLAAILVMDSSKLKEKYKQRKEIILSKKGKI